MAEDPRFRGYLHLGSTVYVSGHQPFRWSTSSELWLLAVGEEPFSVISWEASLG